MFSQVYSADLKLLHWINIDWTSPAMDKVMAFISDFSIWVWPLSIAVLCLLIFGRFRERLLVLLAAFALLVGDAGVVQGIRSVVNRGRPWQTVEGTRKVALSGVEISRPVPFEKGRSLPSGHVCNNVAIVLLLVLLYGRKAHWGWLWAAAIGYSRIYTGSHFPSDVLASIFISLAYTSLLCVLASWIWKTRGSGIAPKMFSRHPQLFIAR